MMKIQKLETFKEAQDVLTLLQAAEERAKRHYDKVVIKFIADLLYIKGIICYDEFEDIMNATNVESLDNIIERMFNDDYNPLLRGEGYCTPNRDFSGE